MFCIVHCSFLCRYHLSAGTSEKIQLGALLGAFQIVRDIVVQQARVLSCLETLVDYAMLPKGLIAAAFESSEPLHLLRHVGAIPTLINMQYSYA